MFGGHHAGLRMFTLQNPRWPVIYDQFQDLSTYNTNADTFQSKRVVFYGVSVGYKKRLGGGIRLEFFLGGLTQSRYKGYIQLMALSLKQPLRKRVLWQLIEWIL